VKAEHGRLDILVNNAAKSWSPLLRRGFWRTLEAVDLITVGLRSHFVRLLCAPLLIANGRGLIVNTSYYGASPITPPVRHMARRRLARQDGCTDMAKELSSVQYRGGFDLDGPLDTERARGTLLSPERLAAQAQARITAITGRVVAALYASDHRMKLSGYV